MELERLKSLVSYDPLTGEMKNARTARVFQPDEYGMITVYDNTIKKKFKMKASTVAWELANNTRLDDNSRVLHRNLNLRDFRRVNLMKLDRKVYNKVQEAVRNLDGHLRLVPHHEDQYSYVILYQENYMEKKEVVHDIIAARSRLIRLQLRFAKLLNKYCIFD